MFAKSVIHDLVFPGQSRKECLHKTPESDLDLDFDTVERWMAMNCPLFDRVFQVALAKSFGIVMSSPSSISQQGELVLFMAELGYCY